MVANEDWLRLYPEASVHHFSMSNSNHCMLVLALKCSQPRKPMKKMFIFEAMWTREDGCREVIELASDPLSCDSRTTIMDKLKHWHDQLQSWNWIVFGHVNKVLKQKQSKLQQLEATKCGNEKAEEIRKLRAEINESLLREEIMWNQRSRALWTKWGDQNTRFFHATDSQR